MTVGLCSQVLQAEGVVSTCTDTAFESAFDNALLGGGLITLTCAGANRLTTTKIIEVDTVISNATVTGSLNGGGSNRFFHIRPGVTLTLLNLQLVGGKAGGGDGADGSATTPAQDGTNGFGGAILNEGGILIASNVTFKSNAALGGAGGQGRDAERLGGEPSSGRAGGVGRGGSLYSLGGTNVLVGCDFLSNRAEGGAGGNGGSGAGYRRAGANGGNAGEGAGGAVFLTGGAWLRATGCRFEDNTAQGAQGGTGGSADGTVYFDGLPGASTSGRGGGVCQEDGTSLFEASCKFSENSAVGADGLSGSLNAGDRDEAAGQDGLPGHGGAIDVSGGSITLAWTTFGFNEAEGGIGGEGGLTAGGGNGGDGGDGAAGRGGAVRATSATTVRIADCSFQGNRALGGFGGFGGFALTPLAEIGEDGSAALGQGGALHFSGAVLEINRCTFDGNGAVGGEGLEGLAGSAYEPGSQGSSGAAGLGGAVYAAAGSLGVTNSTFYANVAQGGDGGKGGNGGSGLAFATDGGDGGTGGGAQGGALWLGTDAEGSVVFSTFARNGVVGGAGGEPGEPGDADLAEPGSPGRSGARSGASLFTQSANLRLLGVLLADPEGGDHVGGEVSDGGFNLSSDATPGFAASGTSTNFASPILLGPLADNGGPTRTIGLNAGSVAIDFGPSRAEIPSDQRGFARDAALDVGAYEVATSLPALSVGLSEEVVVVSWPAGGVVPTLQSSASLSTSGSTNWVTVTGAILRDGRWEVTLAPNQDERYFRLRN
jgi:hypothetical protein